MTRKFWRYANTVRDAGCMPMTAYAANIAFLY